MGKFNFEDYRQPWETGPHWELKKEFIETYEDMFEEDRLLCLAQAYANVVLMNCCYPDPVMRQISELSKPLQLRKKFQGISNTADTETSKNQQSRGKIKSAYQETGRPFKQMKFCASVEQYNSTFSADSINLDQSLSKQFNNSSSSVCDQQYTGSLSKKSVISLSEAIKSSSSVLNQQSTESLFSKGTVSPNNVRKEVELLLPFKGNISTKKEKYEEILITLGLPNIQKFASTLKIFQINDNHSVGVIHSVIRMLGQDKDLRFEIDVDPDSPKNKVLYKSKVFIKNCEIACGTASNKKNAKKLSAEATINTLFELSISCVSSNEEMLQLFGQNLVNRTKKESATASIKSIASLLGMNDYIVFNEVPRKISQGVTEYSCNFCFNGILISTGKSNTSESAKDMAADLGLGKLSNLSEYEIQNNKLESKQNRIDKALKPDLLMPNLMPPLLKTCFEKPSFIFNERMYNLSLRDGFVLVIKEIYTKESQKNDKTMLHDSAAFCHKKYEYQYEDILETAITLIKVSVLINDVVVGTGVANSKEEAKAIACSNAHDDLKKKYYTLKIKEEYVDGFIIRRNQIFDGESYSSNAISESNIGCKMLKNMGWTGGGLGVKGIAEPIQATSKMSLGSGLGFEASKGQQHPQLFRKRLESMLRDFCKSESYSDLVFAKDFSKEERKLIHQLAGRFHLHTQSRGFGNDRFIAVRQKYEVTKLLKFLVNSGGSNSKFELIDDSGT